MTLLDLPLNATAVVIKINADAATLHHIQSLGIIESELIAYVQNSPLGTPRIFRCMDTSLAVRDDVARCVEVELI